MNDQDDLFLSEATRLLDRREAILGGVYWFCGDGDDEGFSYCWDCIHALRPDAERGEDFMGGGCYESDGCELCERCHKLLEYTLTDYGVENELAHFADDESGFDWDDPYQCYELARVAHGIYENEEQSAKLLRVLSSGSNFPDELNTIESETTSG